LAAEWGRGDVMTLTTRAALNLQRRLYDLWSENLLDAVELSEQAGPFDRLDEVLSLIQAAEAGVRAAMAARSYSSTSS